MEGRSKLDWQYLVDLGALDDRLREQTAPRSTDSGGPRVIARGVCLEYGLEADCLGNPRTISENTRLQGHAQQTELNAGAGSCHDPKAGVGQKHPVRSALVLINTKRRCDVVAEIESD